LGGKKPKKGGGRKGKGKGKKEKGGGFQGGKFPGTPSFQNSKRVGAKVGRPRKGVFTGKKLKFCNKKAKSKRGKAHKWGKNLGEKRERWGKKNTRTMH